MRRKHRYVIYATNEDHTAVTIEKLGARDTDWNEFKESMPK